MKKIIMHIITTMLFLYFLITVFEYCKTFQYGFNFNGVGITLTSYMDYSSNQAFSPNNREKRKITVPSHIIGRPVRSLKWTFSGFHSLESIKLPDTVVAIGDHTFNRCTQLTNISFSSKLQSIGDYAFSQCESLKTLTLPSEIEYIGQYAFSGCTNLETIELPEQLLELKEATFYGCTSLETITIPESTITIQNGAFQECSSLKNVYIPSTVTEMEPDIFKDSPLVEIITSAGSTAERYAIENQIPYQIQ